MDPTAGLRARASTTCDLPPDCETVCERRLKSSLSAPWSPVRAGRAMLAARGAGGGLLATSLAITCLLSLACLLRTPGRPGAVGLWEEGQEDEWHQRVGDRVREKLERAREGEDHHALDHEEEHWIERSGLQIHHDPDIVSHLPPGEELHVAVALPFLDQNPLAAESYLKMLEWVTIYSSVRIHFHVITNLESEPYVERIMDQVNLTSNCNFHYSVLSYDHVLELGQASLCPGLAQSEDYCGLLLGRLTPLVLPWLLPDLNYVIYVDRHITFHDDVGKLYNSLARLDAVQGIGAVQEQSPRYMRAFGTHHLQQPGTKLGRPPSRGHPGYNPDLLLLALDRLRGDTDYRASLGELRLSLLMRRFSYHPEETLPGLGDVLNLLAAERPRLFHQLPCEWNKSARQTTDPLMADFLSCLEPADRSVRASNRNPA